MLVHINFHLKSKTVLLKLLDSYLVYYVCVGITLLPILWLAKGTYDKFDLVTPLWNFVLQPIDVDC